MFDKPDTVFEMRLRELLNGKERSSVDLVLNCISYSMFAEGKPYITDLNDIFGFENTVKLIKLFEGKTVTFPTMEEFKALIIRGFCYYLSDVKGLSWKQIKEYLNDPEMNSIKHGLKVRKLRQYIQKELFSLMKEKLND